MAHKFAFESYQITTEAISAVALPEIAKTYNIQGTPQTVLNRHRHLKGRVREDQLLQAILELG